MLAKPTFKPALFGTVLLILLSLLLIAAKPAGVQAQTTPEPPQTTERPIIVVDSYAADTGPLRPGTDFTLNLILRNDGQNNAINIIASFTAGDLIPRGTGGTRAEYQIVPGERKGIQQPITVSPAAEPGSIASLPVTIEYTDQSNGTAYSASFNLSFNIDKPQASSGPARPTATGTAVLRPQLVIEAYETDIEKLQPGSKFNLGLSIRNLGNADARGVTMVVGGGTVDPSVSGTPDPGNGGIQGSGSDLSKFAPLGSSNIHFMGDLAASTVTDVSQLLIVNVATEPGAYSLKFSFIYTDDRGRRYVDDQVITLLVYTVPNIEVSTYMEPGPFFAGQPGPLPLQITNLGRTGVVLGNMRVTSETAEVMNGNMSVGMLDPGLNNTLDAMVMPMQPGPFDVNITINYTNSFNETETITQTLSFEAMEMVVEPIPNEGMPTDPSMGPIDPNTGMPLDPGMETGNETLWDKVVRFFRGLFGLDSGTPTPAPDPGMPMEPMPGEGEPLPAKPMG